VRHHPIEPRRRAKLAYALAVLEHAREYSTRDTTTDDFREHRRGAVRRVMAGILPLEEKSALSRRLREIYAHSFGGVAASPAHVQQMANDSVDEERSIAQLQALVEATGEPLAGKRFLEVGSGIGLTVATARKLMGADAYGIEPGDDEYEGSLNVSRDVLAMAGIDAGVVRRGVGEAIPFPNDHFDVVYSTNVLEHVNVPSKVLAEIIRVLKPGGCAQIVVPNYGSWWEGHYGVVWPPHLSPGLGKLYVRMLGRDPGFIDTLQFVTRGKLEGWMAPHKGSVDILGWGVDIWEQRVRGLGFSEYSALGRLKAILRVLHALKVIPLLIRAGKLFHWETPLILTFRKKVPVGNV
jgi:SAM-dependent methyltransferase